MSYRPVGRRYRAAEPTRISPAVRRAALARINGSRKGHGGGRKTGRIVLTTVLLVFLCAILGAGMLATVSSVATVHALSSDLPDPAQLEQLDFPQPTIIYDRTGKIELGRFQLEERKVITFEDIPPLLLDATTAAEDRTFWENEGFDPAAIGSAIFENVSGESQRGASTITQQLVRARLLPKKYLQPDADRYVRKAKELLQAARVTQAFPGEAGKRRIVTAYLNQIYYGHKAYGIAAAANVYFGITDLRKLSPSQAALLAALPKSPSTLDPYRYARADKKGRLVVPRNSAPLIRRDYVLRGMQEGRWTKLTDEQLQKAFRDPVILAGERPLILRAPHFTWQVKRELDSIVADRAPVETGGYRVITSLDWNAQKLAERYITAGTVLPNMRSRASMNKSIAKMKLGRDASWISRLRGLRVHNGAMVVLDYRRGDVLAYVGSRGYYRDREASPQFDPKYDVAGIGYRQPGSAWKPIMYAAGFEERKITPGTLLLDVTTRFGRNVRTGGAWIPQDADRRERGPVLMRKALQYSLNIPAIRAIVRIGNDKVAQHAEKMGIKFFGGSEAMEQSGPAGAIGTVEVRVIDMTAAFGALGNGGKKATPRKILKVTAPDGSTVYRPAPLLTQAISAQSAFLMTDILESNTNPAENLVWGPMFRLNNGPGGARRPAAVKTGTTNDRRDLSTYGYLAAPKEKNKPALAVGVWLGNSDHSQPAGGDQEIFASQGPGRIWHSFLRDYTNRQPIAQFSRPNGVVQATIDKWSGGAPGPWTRQTTREWFIAGTQPGGSRSVDRPGLLYSPGCAGWMVDPLKAEQGWPQSWREAVAGWIARARRGPGVVGSTGTATAYMWGESSWGGPIIGPCAPPKPPPGEEEPEDPEEPDASPSPGPTKTPKPSPPGGGGGGGNEEPEPEPSP